VSWESGLPGLAAWARVRDWRVGRIREMANIDVYLDSDLTPSNVLDFGFDHVIVATGARWRKDGVGVNNTAPIAGSGRANVFTPEDIVAGAVVSGPVVLFDDDNFYLGGVMAEKLRRDGHAVTLVTTAPCVSSWTENTMEQHRIQARLIELGVDIVTSHNLSAVGEAEVGLACIYAGRPRKLAAACVVMVTSRHPADGLYRALADDPEGLRAAGIKSVRAIGDCDAPATIAAAIHDGHLAARELDEPPQNPDLPFRREEISLDTAV
jgi:dimethylamine/trimethylamine dehydrogenase